MVDDMFPLLRLPEKALMNVLDCMEALHKLNLSLCSTKIGNLVKSSGFHRPSISLILEHEVLLTISFDMAHVILVVFLNYGEELLPNNRDINASHVKVGNTEHFNEGEGDNTDYIWRRDHFEVNDWICHIQFILSCDKIRRATVLDDRFNVESVRALMDGLEIQKVSIGIGIGIELMEVLRPVRNLELRIDPTPRSAKILIQNFDKLELRARLDLNSLLMTNSSYLSYDSDFEAKDLNRFIKLWTAKACCPRLKYMRFRLRRQVLNGESVLKGVKHDVMSDTEERTFKACWMDLEDDLYDIQVKGGFGIRRDDGTEARIVTKEYFDHSTFEMFIWS